MCARTDDGPAPSGWDPQSLTLPLPPGLPSQPEQIKEDRGQRLVTCKRRADRTYCAIQRRYAPYLPPAWTPRVFSTSAWDRPRGVAEAGIVYVADVKRALRVCLEIAQDSSSRQ